MKRRSAGAVVSTSLALMAIWVSLTLNVSMQELALGAGVSVIIALATSGAFTGNAFRLLRPSRLLHAAEYVLYFLGRMLMANVDVLLRVIRPTVPINPGVVRAELSLANGRARNMVANSITLTPGTLTVEMTEDSIFVHWISLPEGDAGEMTQRMVDGFASRLGRVFE